MQEVKFKNSEAGLIPEEWHDPQIGDLLKVGHGKDYKQLKQGDIPVYGTGGYMTSVDQFLHDGPTVCIGRKGTIDKPFYHDGKIWTVDTLFYTHSFKNCDPKFLYYAFQRVDWMSFNEGTTVPSLTSTIIENINVAVPKEKTEQEEISKAISDIDKLIEDYTCLIDKKIAIKQGATQNLLSGKIRLVDDSNNDFETSEIGEYPKDWDIVAIGSFADVVTGATPDTNTPSYWGGNIPWMNSGELNLKFVHEVEGRITEKGYHACSTHEIPEKCVLIGLAGQGKTRGTAAFNFIPLCTNQSIAAILPNDSYYSLYLYYCLDRMYEDLRNASSGDGGRGCLTKQILSEFLVAIPHKRDEQILIADYLYDMDCEIQALEEEKQKYINIKQGMMQQLLTGKIRLV